MSNLETHFADQDAITAAHEAEDAAPDLGAAWLAFSAGPTKATAGAYLEALMYAEGEGDLDDGSFLDGLSEIRDWLAA